jgi:Ni2+-binding GTPase involved in maturation of urease and hydrogenase
MSTVHITATGPVGSGKSAILGEIEIALRAIGIPVAYADPLRANQEKNATHADWQESLERIKPSVILVEGF